MKKSSFICVTLIMTLALVVAIVGVTAAWFGDLTEYHDGPINVSSTNPKNNAIIVPDSASPLPTGEASVLAPAKLKAGYGLNDVNGSGAYDKIKINKDTEYGKNHSAIASPAVPVEVTFDFAYNGSPSNDNGTTTMKIELVSVTLKNPVENDLTGDGKKDGLDAAEFLKTHTNYRDEFGVEMFVTTTSSEVKDAKDVSNGNELFYTEEIDEEGNKYYLLKSRYYYYEPIGGGESEDWVSDPSDSTNPYVMYFDFIPYTHTLNAVIYFLKVDEETAPELIDAQLFLNFEVSFLVSEEGGNDGQN